MELPNSTLIHWDNDLEQLIKDECEISYSYYLLHNLSFIRYSKLNNYINIPVMVIGTFTGASSVGSAALFGNTTIASIVI
jgi:deoxycytidine triphosphate deaminase